jgi:hypothetical protein
MFNGNQYVFCTGLVGSKKSGHFVCHTFIVAKCVKCGDCFCGQCRERFLQDTPADSTVAFDCKCYVNSLSTWLSTRSPSPTPPRRTSTSPLHPARKRRRLYD